VFPSGGTAPEAPYGSSTEPDARTTSGAPEGDAPPGPGNLARRQREGRRSSAAARIVLWCGARLPRTWLRPLAACIAFFAWRLAPGVRSIVDVNLRIAFPDLEDSERRTLGRAVLTGTALSFLELGPAWYGHPYGELARIREVRGLDHLRRGLARGRGVLVLAPHLGSWELLNHYTACHARLTALYLPPRLAAVEEAMVRGRERLGSRLVPTSGQGLKALYRALDRGELVGILPDQVPSLRGGVHVPFFGRPALTMTLVHRLLRRSDPAVLIGCVLRNGATGTVDVCYRPVSRAVHDPDPAVALGAMNDAVEALVREAPEQYQWAYQRWKNPPPGVPSPYDHG
jgi:KDO2-lipid IV(A) lauroyltransferase